MSRRRYARGPRRVSHVGEQLFRFRDRIRPSEGPSRELVKLVEAGGRLGLAFHRAQDIEAVSFPKPSQWS